MCLYPQLVKNPKYKENKKNGGKIPPVSDNRVLYVPIGCGECMECQNQQRTKWQIRLQEDIKEHRNAKFITLTYNNEWYTKISTNALNLKELKHIPSLTGYARDNAIAISTVRLFLERYRKKYKTSLRHWLVTELGHNGTENIHLHGIIWTNYPLEDIEKIWTYGYMWKGKENNRSHRLQNYVNLQTVNYIIKYITKRDEKHKLYKPVILTSPGIGRNYITSSRSKEHTFKNQNTNQTYRTQQGYKINLPIYYKNKLYTDDQKEQLWLQTLDQHTRYVCGEKINVEKTHEEYFKLQKYHQERNAKLGYGNGKKTWEQHKYENARRDMLHEQRTGIIRDPQAPKNPFSKQSINIQLREDEIQEIQRIKKTGRA